MFDWFRGRPKTCSGCGGEDRGIHRVHSGLAGGEETDQLCTSCLLARLEPQLRGRHVLFIEPHSCDSYVYSPIDAIDNPLARERTLLAFASFGETCAACSSPPQHIWMAQEDLDHAAMTDLPVDGYYSIPAEPASWTASLALCDAHVVAQLAQHVEARGCSFDTFRFPDSSRHGHYW